MVPQWIIERKRDGGAIPEAELREFVAAYAAGELPDYQMAAFAMAVYFQGMAFEETVVMTDAMMRSGDVLDWSGLERPTVDKHSTGGIGDKVSIPLAPLVAAAGAAVPMISGRGLGVTGGTLDKLESIPGYDTQLSNEAFRRVLETVGCSIIGQTARLAPADKKLYALRDVTGTVPSIPLISSSIMSKKLAEGVAALTLDVKCGAGAFMKRREDAQTLAETLTAIGRGMGRRVSAFVTAMDQPLGRTAGNAVEIAESIAVLQGRGPADVVELVVALGGEMLALTGLCADREEGMRVVRQKLDSGAGLETFARMVAAQGGDAGIVEGLGKLPTAPVVIDVPAAEAGHVAGVDADGIGRVVLLLGGGRRRSADAIDPAVGVDGLVKVGERVEAGRPLMRLHARSLDEAQGVLEAARAAVALADAAPAPAPLILGHLPG
ncbi:MAG: thymidine phosphorylase [Kiritimatiellia bacterium]|jgi:pyrimidine-nucleoside phosphorylase